MPATTSKMFVRHLSVVLLGLRCVAAVDSLVDVNYTRYQGTPLQNGVTQWLGMRYAAVCGGFPESERQL